MPASDSGKRLTEQATACMAPQLCTHKIKEPTQPIANIEPVLLLRLLLLPMNLWRLSENVMPRLFEKRAGWDRTARG